MSVISPILVLFNFNMSVQGYVYCIFKQNHLTFELVNGPARKVGAISFYTVHNDLNIIEQT